MSDAFEMSDHFATNKTRVTISHVQTHFQIFIFQPGLQWCSLCILKNSPGLHKTAYLSFGWQLPEQKKKKKGRKKKKKKQLVLFSSWPGLMVSRKEHKQTHTPFFFSSSKAACFVLASTSMQQKHGSHEGFQSQHLPSRKECTLFSSRR